VDPQRHQARRTVTKAACAAWAIRRESAAPGANAWDKSTSAGCRERSGKLVAELEHVSKGFEAAR
jgi:hypothetical protein